MVPLRSWMRKLNPEDAPNPDSVGMLNGKMIASGMAANCRCSPAMIPFTCSASPCRSSQGCSRAKIEP